MITAYKPIRTALLPVEATSPRPVTSLTVMGILGTVWLSVLIALSVPTAQADALTDWLNRLDLPSQVNTALHARRQVDPHAPHWLVEHPPSVYVLVARGMPPGRSAQLRQAQLRPVEMRARHGVLLYAAGDAYESQGFTQREAIAKALAYLDTTLEGRLLDGMQTRSHVSATEVASLVWTHTDRIAAYRQNLPTLEHFLPAYCEALYPTALALYQERRYQAALTLYLDMHSRQCTTPMAYFLDAAECFIALNQPHDAQRMASYLLNDRQEALDSLTLERIGDIFFESGDSDTAMHLYEQALETLRGEWSH